MTSPPTMKVAEEDAQVLPSYELESGAADDSPTSHLRRLKEISYILEKLRCNRTRFLLAAAHRRRKRLGSFAAEQNRGAENRSASQCFVPVKAAELFSRWTNIEDSSLQEHLEHRETQRHAQYPHVHQDRAQHEFFSLDVEVHSDARCVGSLSDVHSHEASAHCDATESECDMHPSETACAATAYDVEAAVKHLCKRESGEYDIKSGPGAAYDRLTSAAAADRSARCGSTTLSRWRESNPRKFDSLCQRAPVTLDGDDFDLYLGELLVPLLHDGLEKLCRFIELKQKDATQQRLGPAFHANFNPLRWLGQYLMRHHPKIGTTQEGDAGFAVTAVPSCERPEKHHPKDPASASVHDRYSRRSMNEPACLATLRTADERESRAEAAHAQAVVTHSDTDEASRVLKTARKAAAPAANVVAQPAALGGGADLGSVGGLDSAPEDQAKAENLPAETPGAGAAAATASKTAGQEGNVEGGETTSREALQKPATPRDSTLESVHRRRMQQYASFYGVLKDIVDEERTRRDFLLRREEVKQIFEVYRREKNDPLLAERVSRDSSARGSNVSGASADWGKRLSLTIRKRIATLTDRLSSSARGSNSTSGSPRKFTTASTGRLSSRYTAAEERVATRADSSTRGDRASRGDPTTPRGEMVESTEEASKGTSGSAFSETSPRPERISSETSPRPGGLSSETSPRPRRASQEDPCFIEAERKVPYSAVEARRQPLAEERVDAATPRTATAQTERGKTSDYIPVTVEDFQEILERLDAQWEMNGRFLSIFQEGLPIPIATEHADLLQYLLPEHDPELFIEDPEDVQADEFWEFVKCYTEVHTWIRRELYMRRKSQPHVRSAPRCQPHLVDLLVKKKMVVVEQNEDEDDEYFQTEDPQED